MLRIFKQEHDHVVFDVTDNDIDAACRLAYMLCTEHCIGYPEESIRNLISEDVKNSMKPRRLALIHIYDREDDFEQALGSGTVSLKVSKSKFGKLCTNGKITYNMHE